MAACRPSSPDKYIQKSVGVYSGGERRLILHVYGVLRKENPEMCRRAVAERVTALTGVARSTLELLKKECDEGPLVTPRKKRAKRDRKNSRMDKLSDFEKNRYTEKGTHAI